MRHAVFGKKLSRDEASRKALLNNLASAILVNGKLKTTVAKAKFAQSYVEKIVTLAKKNKLSKNRVLASNLTDSAFLRLTREIAPGFADRKGGYTRIIKLNARRGDASQLARLEFLQWEKPEKKLQTAKSANKKTESTEKKQVLSQPKQVSRVVTRKLKRQTPKKAQNKKGKK